MKKISPDLIEKIFDRTKWRTRRSNNTEVNVHITAKNGDKSFKNLGPYVQNSFPEHIKTETNFIKFKEYIKQQFGTISKCNLCVYINK